MKMTNRQFSYLSQEILEIQRNGVSDTNDVAKVSPFFGFCFWSFLVFALMFGPTLLVEFTR